jgi:hypothetical protein
VQNGGSMTQNHSGLNIRNNTIPANDKRVYIQYILTDSDEEVISLVFLLFDLIMLPQM